MSIKRIVLVCWKEGESVTDHFLLCRSSSSLFDPERLIRAFFLYVCSQGRHEWIQLQRQQLPPQNLWHSVQLRKTTYSISECSFFFDWHYVCQAYDPCLSEIVWDFLNISIEENTEVKLPCFDWFSAYYFSIYGKDHNASKEVVFRQTRPIKNTRNIPTKFLIIFVQITS